MQVMEREVIVCFHMEFGAQVVPQMCPNPRLGSWDFTLPLAPPSHPSTNTQVLSPSLCIISSKDKGNVTLEAKDTKAQENEASDNVLISAPTLPSPASYLESCRSRETHGSLQINIFF